MLTKRSQAIFDAHFLAEEQGDLAGIMATVDENIVFQFHPMEKELVGKSKVGAFYDYFVTSFLPLLTTFKIRDQWASDNTIAVDQVLWLPDEKAGLRAHSALGIIQVNDGFVESERVYLSAELLAAMAGPTVEIMTPLPTANPPATGEENV
jgi:hypothetical protein